MGHSFDNSVSLWIEDLKRDGPQAANELWNRYFERLVNLARRKLGSFPRRAADEEDVAVSVFSALCSGAIKGRFDQLQSRDDLWRLLVAITAQKVVDLIRREQRQKRGGGNVRGESIFRASGDAAPHDLDDFMREDPTPQFLNMLAEEHQRLMVSLEDDSLREIARLRVEGFTNEEIAKKLGLSLRTVERKLASIRATWSDAVVSHSGATVEPLKSDSFTGIPLDLLEPHMHQVRFAAGKLLMRQGEVGDSLMVIRRGTVQVRIEDVDGQQHVLDHGYPGQVYGEMALLTNEPRSADVVATSDVIASVLPAARFHELAAQHTELCMMLTNLVSQRLGRMARDALSDKVLDRYRIKRRLGRGGMGVVYEAEDVDSSDRVALKMLSHRLVYDAEARERFEQEADLVESFDHPCIVKTFGRFTAFHSYFICLEFCNAGSLADAIDASGPLPADRIRHVFSCIASALHYAHRRGIAHRDIKPANILFTGNGDVKLTDFGLAQPIDQSVVDGRLYGTPRYMAPEQLAGEMAGKESDYFALGCVAYEMMTGQPLFSATDLSGLRRLHDQWDIPTIRDLRDDVDGSLSETVQICLHKQPQLRQPPLA